MNKETLREAMKAKGMELDHFITTHEGVIILATAISHEGIRYFVDAFGRAFYDNVSGKGDNLNIDDLGHSYKDIPLVRDTARDLEL